VKLAGSLGRIRSVDAEERVGLGSVLEESDVLAKRRTTAESMSPRSDTDRPSPVLGGIEIRRESEHAGLRESGAQRPSGA
jgi:hypothetical protein